MGRNKEQWTLEEWIEFGNRVKRIRLELMSLIDDARRVCRAKEIDGLFKIGRQLDSWKCSMEMVAIRNMNMTLKDLDQDNILRYIFYGFEIDTSERNGE